MPPCGLVCGNRGAVGLAEGDSVDELHKTACEQIVGKQQQRGRHADAARRSAAVSRALESVGRVAMMPLQIGARPAVAAIPAERLADRLEVVDSWRTRLGRHRLDGQNIGDGDGSFADVRNG